MRRFGEAASRVIQENDKFDEGSVDTAWRTLLIAWGCAYGRPKRQRENIIVMSNHSKKNGRPQSSETRIHSHEKRGELKRDENNLVYHMLHVWDGW